MSLNQSFIYLFRISQNIHADLKGQNKIQTALWLMYGETFYGRHTAQHQLQWRQIKFKNEFL